MIDKLELNKSYSYRDLEEWFSNKVDIDPNMEWNEEGHLFIGKSFISIDETNKTYSFVMDGYNSKHGSSFKLILISE